MKPPVGKPVCGLPRGPGSKSGISCEMVPIILVALLASQAEARREISGGATAARNSLPFMVRLRTRGARGFQGTCGGSLIHPRFILTAYHCFNFPEHVPEIKFERHCLNRQGLPNGKCFAVIAEHFVDQLDPGEQIIPLLKVHRFSENQDLAIVELVEPAVIDNKTSKVIRVSTEELEAGDVVMTAGWGLTGAQGGLSKVLVYTNLEVSKGGSDVFVNTKVKITKAGVPVDPCEGDSGGPLLKYHEDSDGYERVEIHATLHGGGYDCVQNKTSGEGEWNNALCRT